MMLSGLLGKKVKIVKTDRYVKFGILVQEDESFVLLEYRDGNREMINKKDVSAMTLDSWEGGR